MMRVTVLDYVGPDQDGDIVFSNDNDLSLAIAAGQYCVLESPSQITVMIETGNTIEKWMPPEGSDG